MTTTTTATVRGPQPAPADLDTARADLARWGVTDTACYPFMVGVADTLLELIGEAHTSCRKPGCDICRHLRRATAIRIAFAEVRA